MKETASLFAVIATIVAMWYSISGSITEVRNELRVEIAGVRNELGVEIAGVRNELGVEIGGMRNELTDLRVEVGGNSANIKNLQTQMTHIQQILVQQGVPVADAADKPKKTPQ